MGSATGAKSYVGRSLFTSSIMQLSPYNAVLSLGVNMKRREFLEFVGSAVAWPVAARARAMPLIFCHPLTDGLLRRARWMERRCGIRDRDRVESILDRRSEMSGKYLKPVKWVERFEDVYWQLARNPSLVMDLGPNPFWAAGSDVLRDPDPSRWSDLRHSMAAKDQAKQYFGCDEHAAYFDAIASRIDEKVLPSINSWEGSWEEYEELFKARCQPFQIANEVASVASNSVGLIDLSIRLGHSAESERIGLLLTPIEAYESGLMATWETADEMICMLTPETLGVVS
jgi:hypothetical protein